MIPVTRPYLPDKEKYQKYIDQIFSRNWLTNNGPLVNELEMKIKEHQGLKHLIYVSNGTIALQLAIKALELEGEIITTPFSFVATTSSIVWEGCQPVFVDIDEDSLNIDPAKIEAAITDRTSAILATHVYGNPCDIEAIQNIAEKHGLKVIYDAAHCFGVRYQGRSIFEYGDISTCSFHATKLFHTIEGGMVVTKDPVLLKKLAQMRNFGFAGPDAFSDLGINAKNSEVHAAMGLCILPDVEKIIQKRQDLCNYYDQKLQNLHVRQPVWTDMASFIGSYYPVIFEDPGLMQRCKAALEGAKIYPRRYFYPALSTCLPYVDHHSFPVTEKICKKVLCLPLYFDISYEEIDLISRLMLRVQNN